MTARLNLILILYLLQDRYNLFVTSLAFEFHYPGNFGKQSIILADTDIESRVNFRSALPDDDGSGRYCFTGVRLDTHPLTVTVTAVS